MDRSLKGKSMAVPNPIPTGPYLNGERQLKRPASRPKLRAAWTATVLLSPFGDSVSPLSNGSQLVVGNIEASSTPTERWMRARLYLTQDHRYFEFVFMTVRPDDPHEERHWYWIDTSPKGPIANIYGPFPTTLRVPGPGFFAEAVWGNAYPLMCTDMNQQGIDCDHWLMPSPGPPGRGSWYSFRRDTGQLFRILMVDSTNPLMVPIVGSYFIANLPTFTGRVSDKAKSLIKSIKRGETKARPEYWNPMVTQQDIQRAMAFPLASAACNLSDVAAVIPGFTAATADAPLPRWSDNTYAHGWSISADFVPYFTRVCYLWTGDDDSKQQTVFIGVHPSSEQSPYLQRTDTCLNTIGTLQPHYEWQEATTSWSHRSCVEPDQSVALPNPDWLTLDRARIMGKICGNQHFGLAADQTLSLIAAQAPRGGGEWAIFWVWFLENETGMLFSEGNYMNPLSHNLQLIDYNVFVRDAGLTQDDFSNPCGPPRETGLRASAAHGHCTQIGRKGQISR
jgi:hypothetical protein